MNDVDIDTLRGWIGRTETAEDVITPRLVREFRATLGHHALARSDIAPPAIHWCLAPPAQPPEMLGRDGHPQKGGFLPPVPLLRRMWAGGSIDFLQPLLEGDVVTRTSRIADIAGKVGRSGRLVFVAVNHEFATERGIAVREQQDIVYREDQTPGVAKPAGGETAAAEGPADHCEAVAATTTLLFRYSALTFNGHRIHYDRDYARDVEGYSGLVVHGPLQATLMVHLAARLRDCPVHLLYRGVAPLFDGGSFTVNAAAAEKGLSLWTADETGQVAMRARAEW